MGKFNVKASATEIAPAAADKKILEQYKAAIGQAATPKATYKQFIPLKYYTEEQKDGGQRVHVKVQVDDKNKKPSYIHSKVMVPKDGKKITKVEEVKEAQKDDKLLATTPKEKPPVTTQQQFKVAASAKEIDPKAADKTILETYKTEVEKKPKKTYATFTALKYYTEEQKDKSQRVHLKVEVTKGKEYIHIKALVSADGKKLTVEDVKTAKKDDKLLASSPQQNPPANKPADDKTNPTSTTTDPNLVEKSANEKDVSASGPTKADFDKLVKYQSEVEKFLSKNTKTTFIEFKPIKYLTEEQQDKSQRVHVNVQTKTKDQIGFYTATVVVSKDKKDITVETVKDKGPNGNKLRLSDPINITKTLNDTISKETIKLTNGKEELVDIKKAEGKTINDIFKTYISAIQSRDKENRRFSVSDSQLKKYQTDLQQDGSLLVWVAAMVKNGQGVKAFTDYIHAKLYLSTDRKNITCEKINYKGTEKQLVDDSFGVDAKKKTKEDQMKEQAIQNEKFEKLEKARKDKVNKKLEAAKVETGKAKTELDKAKTKVDENKGLLQAANDAKPKNQTKIDSAKAGLKAAEEQATKAEANYKKKQDEEKKQDKIVEDGLKNYKNNPYPLSHYLSGYYPDNFKDAKFDIDLEWDAKDVNDDGTFDKTEAKLFVDEIAKKINDDRAVYYDPKTFDELFKTFDTNNDEYLCRAEMAMFIKKTFAFEEEKKQLDVFEMAEEKLKCQITLDMKEKDFVKDSFVPKLAKSLGIEEAQMRITDVREGSVIVDYEIIEDKSNGKKLAEISKLLDEKIVNIFSNNKILSYKVGKNRKQAPQNETILPLGKWRLDSNIQNYVYYDQDGKTVGNHPFQRNSSTQGSFIHSNDSRVYHNQIIPISHSQSDVKYTYQQPTQSGRVISQQPTHTPQKVVYQQPTYTPQQVVYQQPSYTPQQVIQMPQASSSYSHIYSNAQDVSPIYPEQTQRQQKQYVRNAQGEYVLQ